MACHNRPFGFFIGSGGVFLEVDAWPFYRGTRSFNGSTTGGREGIRTLDLSVANAALSQLSYAPIETPQLR